MGYKAYWARAIILKSLKKWEVWYTDLKDKDITSYVSIYKIKNIKTERVVVLHYAWPEKYIEELTAVYKD